MTIKEQIEADIKTAMLAGEKDKVTTLRGLKAAIINEEVAKGTREAGLDDAAVTALFQKESKKRQESSDFFKCGGNDVKAAEELVEKNIIAGYLPVQMDEAAIKALVTETVAALGLSGPQAMGQVITVVKEKTAGSADGSVIARLAREALS